MNLQIRESVNANLPRAEKKNHILTITRPFSMYQRQWANLAWTNRSDEDAQARLTTTTNGKSRKRRLPKPDGVPGQWINVSKIHDIAKLRDDAV